MKVAHHEAVGNGAKSMRVPLALGTIDHRLRSCSRMGRKHAKTSIVPGGTDVSSCFISQSAAADTGLLSNVLAGRLLDVEIPNGGQATASL
jgi:hypothetical protein